MTIKILGKVDEKTRRPIPFMDGEIPAGFPSQADDYLERPLDLHDLIVEHPTATFFIKVEGDSMLDAHIQSGDILVVDRALTPADGKIIVALVDGEFTVKRLKILGDKIFLVPENRAYKPIQIKADSDFKVWGVVSYVIHRTR